jgi:hypothetical protein
MKVVVTGATGLVGTALVRALVERGDEVIALTRSPERASERLHVPGVAWQPETAPAPVSAFDGVTAVVHLAGENIAQRWSGAAKRRIRESRVAGTKNLVDGLRDAGDRGPTVLVSASAVGYYGDRGEAPLDESASAGSGFLPEVCAAWEREAAAAEEFGMRVVLVRTGVILDGSGGALAKMLPPFKLGVGGPVAGGQQYVPWVALDDIVGIYLGALDGGEQWAGPVNACAPTAVTNAELSKALGRALHRPAVLPVPGVALRGLYGEMASVVTDSARMRPARALELGYEFRYPQLDDALRAALAS